MRQFKKKKSQFADLPEEFKDSVSSMNPIQVREEIAKVALAEEEMQRAKKADGDLAEKQEVLKYAMEPYRAGTKMNRLKIQFLRQVLSDRGAL